MFNVHKCLCADCENQSPFQNNKSISHHMVPTISYIVYRIMLRRNSLYRIQCIALNCIIQYQSVQHNVLWHNIQYSKIHIKQHQIISSLNVFLPILLYSVLLYSILLFFYHFLFSPIRSNGNILSFYMSYDSIAYMGVNDNVALVP